MGYITGVTPQGEDCGGIRRGVTLLIQCIVPKLHLKPHNENVYLHPGGATQYMNVGNDCGTSRPPFLGFHRFQNWHWYNHRSNFWLILLEIVSNIVLGNIGGNLFLQFSYSIQIRSLQLSYLVHHF